MTFRQICVLVACDTGQPYSTVKAVLSALLSAVTDGLSSGKRVWLGPVGAMLVRRRILFRPRTRLKAAVAGSGGPETQTAAALARSQGYAELGQLDAAIEVLERAVSDGQENAELHHQLALLQLRKGRERQASEQLESAGRGEAPPSVRVDVGYTWMQMGHADKAADIFRELIQGQPDMTDALVGLALVHQKRGCYHDAAGALQKALEVAPDSADVHFHMAVVYHHLERYEEALASLQKAKELGSSDARVFWYLGLVYDHMGRAQDAQAMYRTYKELQREE